MIEFIPSKRKPRSLIKYGKLYDWNAATGGTFITGMAVPSESDLNVLLAYITNNYPGEQGDHPGADISHPRKNGTPVLISEYHNTATHPRWSSGSTYYGRDVLKFSALPAGAWDNPLNDFYDQGGTFFMWLTDSVSQSAARYWAINLGSGGMYITTADKNFGFNIRCFRLATTTEQNTFGDGQIVERVQDYDDNWYDCIRIGTQIWTRQSIATASYTDGSKFNSLYDYDDDPTNTFFANQSESIW